MKITVFTSNQPRHLALVNRLASVGEVTYALLECSTVFPGLVDDFYKKSKVMQSYFEKVMAAEKKIFGDLMFLPQNVRTLPMKSGDLNLLEKKQLNEALNSDVYIVFGASYIKGWLADFLVEQSALNIHMGISPYYRGASCNFWALYDGHPEYVGATIHLLSKGLDSGPILYHALPKFNQDSPFDFTMRAVEAAQLSLVERIKCNEIKKFTPLMQDKSHEIRYSKNAEFNDVVATEFLKKNMDAEVLGELLSRSKQPKLIDPFFV